MTDPHPINRTLLTMLDNQQHRTDAAFDGLDDDAFAVEPGGDCNSIQRIARHLLMLRRFQLALLESPAVDQIIIDNDDDTGAQAKDAIDRATTLVREAITAHDPDDWYRAPEAPRDGMWGELPTIERFIRPFNDFTNHLGAIRAIRRIRGCGQERTQ